MILYPVLGKASPFGVSWSLSLARFPEEQREFDTVKVFSKRGTICHDTVWEAAPGDLLPRDKSWASWWSYTCDLAQ